MDEIIHTGYGYDLRRTPDGLGFEVLDEMHDQPTAPKEKDMPKHADDEPVMYGFASGRNISMHSQKGGEELGYTWGDWREMSEKERNGALQDAANELVDVWIEGGEDHTTAINPAAHRCQWDMPDDVQPDSEQCPDAAIDGGQLCQTHQDQHDDLMDAMRRDEEAAA